MQLSTLRRDDGSYLWLDFSDIFVIADALGLELNNSDELTIIHQMIEYSVVAISSLLSGIILGPEVGLNAMSQKAPQTGLLLTLFRQLETVEVTSLPTIFTGWSTTHICNNYGVLFNSVFYHPKGEDALHKKQLLAELYDATRYEGIDQVVGINLYPPSGDDTTEVAFQESQLLAARELQKIADALVLEYPHSPLACATLTAELDVPWILADKVADYAYSKDIIRTALEAGAVGCVLGGSLWSGIPKFDLHGDLSQQWSILDHFLQTEVRDRLIEISRIISENIYH